MRLVPRNGTIVCNGDDENLAPLLEKFDRCPVLRVGTGEHCDVRILHFRETPQGSEFSLAWRGNAWGHVAWTQSGIFNARNAAMAATACALFTATDKPEWAFPFDALAKFQGVKRRREILLETRTLVAIEDFGHHPTALALTLRALRERYPQRKLIAAFEPRSNTAVRKIMQNAFADSLATADCVFIAPVHHASQGAEKMDTAEVASNLRSRGVEAHAPSSLEQLFSALESEAEEATEAEPALVVFFSNGAFGGIIQRFASRFRPLV